MTADRSALATPGALWQRVSARLQQAEADSELLDTEAVMRIAGLLSAALAGQLLGDAIVDAALGEGAVASSRLANRFTAAGQHTALSRLAALGFEPVVLKGFAFAYSLYPAPDLRTIGDLDILVRAGDRDRLIAALGAEGFAFRPLPTPPWGFISTASYMPFVSGDGMVNLDIHVHPDCYPAYRSLTTETVFAASRHIDAAGLAIRVPHDTHAFVLCATNTAKDKFGAYTARKLVDALALLAAGRVDLTAALDIAKAGGFAVPYRVFLALLHSLGGPLPDAYAAETLPIRSRREFARIFAETSALYPTAPGRLATLRRELTACTELSVGLHNLTRRLAGLVRPASGIPEGAETA